MNTEAEVRMGLKKVSASQAKGLTGLTNWRKVKAMTDADIDKAIRLDPDAKELPPGPYKRGPLPLK